MNITIATTKMKTRLLSKVICVCIIVFSASIHALPIYDHTNMTDVPDISFGLLNMGDPGGPSAVSYNADTDIFSARLIGGSGLVPGGINAKFSGIFDLTAEITETGELIGGSASWVGSSTELDIDPGSLLLGGNITDVDFDLTAGRLFKFLIDVTFSQPQLGFGPVAGLTLFQVPRPYNDNPFIESFTARPWSHDDLNNIEIPEPKILLLIGLGVFMLFFIRDLGVHNVL